MNITALVVGRGMLNELLKTSHLCVEHDYDTTSRIHNIGCYKLIPVYWDEDLPPDKILIVYKQNSSGDALEQGIVDHWREELPDHPEGDDWVLLTDRRTPADDYSRGFGKGKAHCRAGGRAQGDPGKARPG